jgi:uncharacterized protein YkwD
MAALILSVGAMTAIGFVSPSTTAADPTQIQQAGFLDLSLFGRVSSRLEPSLDTPSPTPAPTPEPTPQPTPDPATEAYVAPAPAPVRPAPQPAAAPQPTPVPPTPSSGYRDDIAQTLYTLLNNARTANGLATVAANGVLLSSAQYYTKLHFTTANPYQLNHYLDGGPGDRAWARGYCCAVGEILVTSEGSPQGMVDLWMSSPPHHAVIVDPQYHEIGVSCYGGLFTSPDGSQNHPVLCSAEFGSGGG